VLRHCFLTEEGSKKWCQTVLFTLLLVLKYDGKTVDHFDYKLLLSPVTFIKIHAHRLPSPNYFIEETASKASY